LVGPRHRQNRLPDFRIRQGFISIEKRLDIDRRDKRTGKRKDNRYNGSPNPPCALRAPEHCVKNNQQ
jgi:hypothetical protein